MWVNLLGKYVSVVNQSNKFKRHFMFRQGDVPYKFISPLSFRDHFAYVRSIYT